MRSEYAANSALHATAMRPQPMRLHPATAAALARRNAVKARRARAARLVYFTVAPFIGAAVFMLASH